MKKLSFILSTILIVQFFLFFGIMYRAVADEYTILTTQMPPYVEKNSGLAIDIVKELFKKAELNIKIQTLPLKRALRMASIKKNTFAVPVQRSQERETEYKWVGPILITETALFSLSNDDIKIDVFKDAFPYRILVARGSADEEYLRGFGIETDIGNNDGVNVNKLKRKRTRLWAADSIVASYYAKKEGVSIKKQITIITTLRSLACNINTPDTVISMLNKTLNVMYSDGTIKKIFAKYAKEFDIKDAAQFIEGASTSAEL
ncbi:MAG: hypothetical protein B6I31_02960 [Desulfobacteraceae bacterium 4572_19]|nr:MAG: hypothetical protein B6I31_02960 [Desulfobacteraceae bacterium 4572_19]